MVTSVVQTSESAPSLKMNRGSEDCQSWPGLFWVFKYELYTGFIIPQRKGQNTEQIVNLDDSWKVFSEGFCELLISFKNDLSDLTFESGISIQAFCLL